MDLKIECPVRFNEQYEIVDKWNNVVIPSITWSRDFNHLDRQKAIGELVVRLMNEDHMAAEASKVSENGNSVSSEVIVGGNAKVEGAETRVRNPWGRGGKPK